jgi:hypothetical protein
MVSEEQKERKAVSSLASLSDFRALVMHARTLVWNENSFPSLKRRKQTLNFWRENSKSKRSKKDDNEKEKETLMPDGAPIHHL